MQCPNCLGMHFRNKGPRRYSSGTVRNRYLCLDCNKGFSVGDDIIPSEQHLERRGEMKERNPKEAQLRRFASHWNDLKRFPRFVDLERVFKGNIPRMARSYREYRKKRPEANLPEIYLRRPVAGGVVAISPAVMKQLEPFHFDTSKFKGKGFVVTGAQFGASLNKGFWEALKHYERVRGLSLVVMPIKYGMVATVVDKETRERYLPHTFPDELHGRMLFEDFRFSELALNVARLRPTLERFLTDTICELGEERSQIYAAPKLELEHRPRVGRKYPKAIMTTGACTHPNYTVDNLGQQDRTGEVALANHTYAAIVVEFQGKRFHFRQLLANKKGEFYDINYKKGGADYFTSEGVRHDPEGVDSLVCGDWHCQKTDPKVRRGTFGKGSMTAVLKPKNVILHDFVDCDSVSHWEEKQAARRAYKAPLHHDALEDELNWAVKEIHWMRSSTNAQLHIIPSNHNEYVTEYVETMRWVRDDRNIEIGARLLLKMIEDLKRRKPRKFEAQATDPVVMWFREHTDAVVHERQDALLLPKGHPKAILCSMHGDIGPRGAPTRGTIGFRKMNRRIYVAHNHSAAILGSVWRVGVSTPLKVFYITTPSTDWSQTHGLILKNGQRQLLNFINGHWHP